MTAVLLRRAFKVSGSLYLYRICSSFTCGSGSKENGVEMMCKACTFIFHQATECISPFHLRKYFFNLFRSVWATAKSLREYFVSKRNFSSSILKHSWTIKCWGPNSATFTWLRTFATRYSETAGTKYLHCLKAKKKKKTSGTEKGKWKQSTNSYKDVI